MKLRAEEYLLNECPNLRPVIMRPGKVYVGGIFEHYVERLPFKRNYTHMDAVVASVQAEISRIVDENGGMGG